MTLYGWDASDFDWPRGPMDLGAAYRDGIRFFTHKATEGTGVQHVHYGEAMSRARSAGIPFLGAYHVVRSGDVAAEVAYFLTYLDRETPWWGEHPGFFFQVDLEKWPYDPVTANQGVVFGGEAQKAGGKVSLLYASQGQFGNGLGGSLALWNANYGTNPVAHYRDAYPGDTGVGWSAYSGRVPRVWQYGSQLRIGSQPGCDANAFRGTEADFAAMIGWSDYGNIGGDTDMITYVQERKVPGDTKNAKGLFAAVWECQGGWLRWLSASEFAGSRWWSTTQWHNAFGGGMTQVVEPGSLGAFGALRPGTAVPPSDQWSGRGLPGVPAPAVAAGPAVAS